MNMPSLSEQVAVKVETQTKTLRLHGRWLVVARSIWVIVAVMALGIFIASIPAYFAFAHRICTGGACKSGAITTAYLRQMQAVGIPLNLYIAYMVGLYMLFTAGFFFVGGIIFWRRSDDRMALLASFFLVTFVCAFNGNLLNAVLPDVLLPVELIEFFFGSVSICLFFYTFPDGHFAPYWSRWLMLVASVYWVLDTFFPYADWNPVHYALLNMSLFLLLLGSMVGILIYRYRLVLDTVQRQQTKWVVFGTTLGLGGFLGLDLLYTLSPSPLLGGPIAHLSVTTGGYLFILLIPLSISFAILRSRLFAIDILIHRTLVMGH